MKSTMKLAALAAIALGAATTITSCNKGGGGEPARDEVQIFTSVDGMTRAPQLDATGEGVFSNGDTFGLLVMANGGDDVKRFDYTVGSTKLYWDQLPEQVDVETQHSFLAVYPNVPEFTDKIMFNFNAATAENPDLLIARATAPENEAVQLTFSHAMHKLNVKLTSNFFTDAELATAEVQPTLQSTALVNVWGGANPDGATTDNWGEYPVKTGANTSWIVAPQKLAAEGMLLAIWVGEYYMTYRVPASLTVLEGGKVTTLKLDLHRDAVSLEGKDVSQWGTENDVPGTINVTE